MKKSLKGIAARINYFFGQEDIDPKKAFSCPWLFDPDILSFYKSIDSCIENLYRKKRPYSAVFCLYKIYSADCAGYSGESVPQGSASSLLRSKEQFTIDMTSAKIEKMRAHIGEAPNVAAPAKFCEQRMMHMIRYAMDTPAETAENTHDKVRGRAEFLWRIPLAKAISATVPAANISTNSAKIIAELVSIPDMASTVAESSIVPIAARIPMKSSGADVFPDKALSVALVLTERMSAESVASSRKTSSNPTAFRT